MITTSLVGRITATLREGMLTLSPVSLSSMQPGISVPISAVRVMLTLAKRDDPLNSNFGPVHAQLYSFEWGGQVEYPVRGLESTNTSRSETSLIPALRGDYCLPNLGQRWRSRCDHNWPRVLCRANGTVSYFITIEILASTFYLS